MKRLPHAFLTATLAGDLASQQGHQVLAPAHLLVAWASRRQVADAGISSSDVQSIGCRSKDHIANRWLGRQRGSSTARVPNGNINGEWTHDLHKAHNRSKQPSPAPNTLAARIHAPGTTVPKVPTQPRQNRTAKLADAYNRVQANAPPQPNVQRQGQGMAIRGLAGPFAIMAQNFAPGTTAADIESAMTPVGGLVTACRLIKTHPIVIAEIIFESKEGAERVIQTFNNQNVRYVDPTYSPLVRRGFEVSHYAVTNIICAG